MKALTFTITTIQPVLASALEGDPNSSETHPYIPGSIIRGALIARYPHPIDLSNPTVQRLFFSTSTRFLHAYPLHKGTQVIPFPQKIRDRTVPPKEPTYEWLSGTSKSVKFNTTRYLNIHTTRNRAKGRSTRNSGAVYRYVAIAPNQPFQGIIIGDDSDLAALANLLDKQTIWLGGARSAGYGEVSISAINIADWTKTLTAPTNQPSVVMTLLSDAIVRDSNGQYARSLTGAMFGLGNATLDFDKSNIKYTVVGGFNRKWGLPLPQTPALAAGSVLVWNNATQIDIEYIQAEGIGERRNEGYGRVSFDQSLQQQRTNAKKRADQKRDVPAQTRQQPQYFASEGNALLQTLGTRLVRQKLNQTMVQLLAQHSIKPSKTARNSLFGRVELWARRLLENIERTNEYSKSLKQLHDRVNAVAQTARLNLRATRLASDESLATLLMKDSETITSMWQSEPIKFGEQHFSVTPLLAVEYHARLIIALVTVARKASDVGGNIHG